MPALLNVGLWIYSSEIVNSEGVLSRSSEHPQREGDKRKKKPLTST